MNQDSLILLNGKNGILDGGPDQINTSKTLYDHLSSECGNRKMCEDSNDLFSIIRNVLDHLDESGELVGTGQMLMAEKNRLKVLGDNFPNGCLFRFQVDAQV